MDATRQGRYHGMVVYMYAFDVAYDMVRKPVTTLMGQPVRQFSMDLSRRNPRDLLLFRPQTVRLPPCDRVGPNGSTTIQRTVKLLPVGALSIAVHVPFRVGNIQELVKYHDLRFSNGSLNDEVRTLANAIRLELAPYFVLPAEHLGDAEAYTVFCLEAPLSGMGGEPRNGEGWLAENRREIASLLTEESDLGQLSEQEVAESTGRYLCYYESDLVVIDWDAALVVDEPGDFEETLYVLEIANAQLAELEAYDRILDARLDRSYRDLRARPSSRGDTVNDLRELRIDLARFSDEISNITKFIGDWHLARIYQCVSARFHLGDWHRSIDEKLKTLDDLYQILKHDQMNRWMLVLEVTIVLLFVVDLVLLYFNVK